MSGSHFIAQTSTFLLIDATAVTLGQGHGKVIQYISPDPYILCAKYPRKRIENTVNPDRGDLNIGSLFPYVYSIMKKQQQQKNQNKIIPPLWCILLKYPCYYIHIYIYTHWIQMIAKTHLSSLSLWQRTFIMTTDSATSDDKVVKSTIFCFQWYDCMIKGRSGKDRVQ